VNTWGEKVFQSARAARALYGGAYLCRAGLEALPLRARKFLSFSHPENARIPTNLCLTCSLKGQQKAVIAKLRIKATLDFWTFQPPLRRPGLRGKHIHWGRAHAHRAHDVLVSAQYGTRLAHARRAAMAAACAQEMLTATCIEACRRCSSPAVGMSMPEARTRLTPLTVDVLLLIQLDATRTHEPRAATELTSR
jgi:hypothetical protein